MPITVYVVAAVACMVLAILLAILHHFSSRLSSVEDERDDILGEEMRMFDFLHHLGRGFAQCLTEAPASP